MIDLASDLAFILGDVPGSVLVQCGAQSGPGLLTSASKLAEHRAGNLEYQGAETVLIFDPVALSGIAKGVSVQIGGKAYTVPKPVKLRDDGSAMVVVVAA